MGRGQGKRAVDGAGPGVRLLGLDPAWAELLGAVPAAFYVDRLDGTSAYVSPQIEGLMGCTREEWASGYDVWLSRIHPEDRDRVRRLNEEFLRTGSPEGSEYRVILPDGKVRWIHERAALVPGQPGEEPLIHGVIVDVTPERLCTEVAERVGRLFQTLVEHSGEAVTIVDEQGVVMYQNPSMGRVVGRSPEWFKGRTPLELMPPEDAERGRQILMALQGRPGAQLPGEFRLKHRDGSWKTVVGVATNLLHDPAVRGIVLNYRDVTDERAAARNLRAAEQRRQTLLESIVRIQTDERSRIAEELHDDTIQVMTASLMELDRLDRHLQRGDIARARASVADARRTLSAASERTRRLTFELRPQLLEAAGLSAAVRDLAEALANDTGAEVKVRTRLGRYPPDTETLVYRTIREALINIRKHAHASHVTIRVGTRGGAIDGEIIDDGRGFRAERRSRVSTHIGLDTTRERLHLVGGTFEVVSTRGQGTRIHFRIPPSLATPGKPAAAPARSRARKST